MHSVIEGNAQFEIFGTASTATVLCKHKFSFLEKDEIFELQDNHFEYTVFPLFSWTLLYLHLSLKKCVIGVLISFFYGTRKVSLLQ